MAHALVQPGTVVVHFEHTVVADGAVVGAGGFGGDALLTHAHRLHHLEGKPKQRLGKHQAVVIDPNCHKEKDWKCWQRLE